jgi:hypothetical protein
MTFEIATAIEIKANPRQVWDILTNFSRYPEWNHFLPKINGIPVAGASIRFVFEIPRGLRLPACAVILKAEAEKELRWAGGVRGVFRAEHYFLLEPIYNSTLRFRHGEIFTGFLAPVIWRLFLAENGPPVYEAMNLTLKGRAE